MNARLPSTVTNAEERAARAARDVAGDPYGQEIADQPGEQAEAQPRTAAI
jgi:hypothetical protein